MSCHGDFGSYWSGNSIQKIEACLVGTIWTPGVFCSALGIDAVERVGDIGLAGLDHQGPRRRLGDAAHDDRLDVRHMAPVMREGLEDDLDAGLGADELVGAGADRVLLEAVVADLLE